MKIKIIVKASWVLALAYFLTACSSMSKEECQVVDWYAIGYSSGLQGQGIERFESTQQACADYKIKADFSGFNRGYENGLVKFCTFERGKTLATSGKPYASVCPSHTYANFSKGYTQGKNIFCSAENGYAIGQQGKVAGSFCAANEFPEYVNAHKQGFKTFCSYENGKYKAENGTKVDQQCSVSGFPDYHAGYAKGLTSYCSFERGFEIGKNAKSPHEQCTLSDFSEFEKGFVAGLEKFCTYESGFELGHQGAEVNHLCQQNSIEAHHIGFQDGQARLALEMEVAQLNKDIEKIALRIEKVKQKITLAERLIVDPLSSSEARQQALDDIKQLQTTESELLTQQSELKALLIVANSSLMSI